MLFDFHLFHFAYSGFCACWGWTWWISGIRALSQVAESRRETCTQEDDC